MNRKTIQRLNDINRTFYEITASEFDQTRGRAWQGWERLVQFLEAPLTVFDVGCGNGRFAVFLAEALEGQIAYHGVDNNRQLLDYATEALESYDNVEATFTEQDVVTGVLPDATYDLVVLFGVIHHVPGAQNRLQFLAKLAQRVKSGGLLAFAAWRFYEYERFRERLVDFPDDMAVERHDYLLDWRRGERALRYCHYVDDDELNRLITATAMREVTRYRADGADDAMNMYVVLQK